MAGHYWAYRDGADVRSAWAQLVCVGCMGPTMALVEANKKGYDGCFVDGQMAMDEDALHTIWLTLYVPGDEPRTYQMDVCDDCLDAALTETRHNSRLLPDRRGGDGGPPTPTQDPWAAFR